MNNYDFRSLNDKEFEVLSRDLLQKELNITLESFKAGKDGGIDLRCANAKDNKEIIVQAKHWSKSGTTKLIAHLEKTELKKVKKLNPDRYLLTTSVELSPKNKKEIKKIFDPYIISETDIFGKDDLNNLLGKFKEVEESHYKLWLSSTNILRRIIHNGIYGRSEFVAETIIKNIKLYVLNTNHKNAEKILDEQRFLVIIGEPGIGKTSLARMIIYKLLSKNYQLVVISDTKEAEEAWKPNSKQVFYFDDFLGSNYLELTNIKNGDSNIISFIKRVKEDPTKRLILTSRTTILNQAENKLAKLKDPIIDLSKHEVKIKDYNKFDKALILYNHLYFNDLPETFYEKITEDKNYLKIINHKNFNPRIIEFITDINRIKDVDPDDYLSIITNHLDNPSLIWEMPYEQQIDEYSRFLLTTLFSLDKPSDVVLQKAFEARLNYEIKSGNFQRINNAFLTKVRDLLGGFIISSRDRSSVEYSFFNPSIVDFLINYLNKNKAEKWRILESIVFLEQFTFRFKNNPFMMSVNFTPEELTRLYKLISKKEPTLEFLNSGSNKFSLLNLYYNFFDIDYIQDDVLRLLKKINWYEIAPYQSSDLSYFLESLSSCAWAEDIISKNWDQIIECFLRNANEQEDFDNIFTLFSYYNKDYNEYINEPENQILVARYLEEYWDKKIDDIEWDNEEVAGFYSEGDVVAYLNNLHDNAISFNNKFGVKIEILDKIIDINAEEIVQSNKEKARAEDYMTDIQEEGWSFGMHKDKEEDERIADLFYPNSYRTK